MTPLMALVVGSGPILVASIIALMIHIWKKGVGDCWDPGLIYAILSIAGFCMPYAWHASMYFGLSMAVSVYVTLAALVIYDTTVYGGDRWANVGIGLVLLNILLVVVAIPVSVLPQFGSRAVVARVAPRFTDSLSTTELENRFNELTETMNDQRKRVQSTMRTLQEQMSEQGQEIARLRDSRQELLNEIETYKRMSQVSEGEAEAIRRVLMKDKYVDYLFGFLIGVVSSGTVALASKLSVGRSKQ